MLLRIFFTPLLFFIIGCSTDSNITDKKKMNSISEEEIIEYITPSEEIIKHMNVFIYKKGLYPKEGNLKHTDCTSKRIFSFPYQNGEYGIFDFFPASEGAWGHIAIYWDSYNSEFPIKRVSCFEYENNQNIRKIIENLPYEEMYSLIEPTIQKIILQHTIDLERKKIEQKAKENKIKEERENNIKKSLDKDIENMLNKLGS